MDSDHRLQYRLGFQECLSETARFLVDLDGSCTADDTCFRLVAHLQKHFDKVSGAGEAAALVWPQDSHAAAVR